MQKAGLEETVEIIIDEEPRDPKIVSVREAAKMYNVTVQTIYIALWRNRLKSLKRQGRLPIKIHVDELAAWRKTLYSREKSTYGGQPLYDNSQGYYSCSQAASIMGVPAQKVYYAARMGWLRSTRKGPAWVIHSEDIKKYYNDIVLRQAPRRKRC